MTELYMCIGIYLGLCGQVRTVQYESPEMCQRELQRIEQGVKVEHIMYCRPARNKP